jgi:4-amino-4-deoxy-L-arabinose transferase-like glycosyltransferase
MVGAKENKCNWVLFAICLFFSLTLTVWWLLDHTYPQWDAANHTRAAVHYASLLKHAHIFNSNWYREFLAVDYQYPFVVNVINGLLKVIFGVSRLSEVVAYVFYQLILIISVYGLGRVLLKDRLAAALAAILINFYPLVSSLSHVQLLDYGSLCFNAFALYGIARWLEKPGKLELALMTTGVTLAANCKLISAFLVIGPCLYLFFNCLFKRDYKRLRDLLITGGVTTLLLAVWVVPNFGRLRTAQVISNAECLKDASYLSVCFSHAANYITGLPLILSPLLFALAILAAVFLALNKQSFRPLWLPLLANFSGIAIMSLIAASRSELRYIAPVTITAALISALWLAQLWRSDRMVVRLCVCLVGMLAMLQFAVYNYSPYPIGIPPSLAANVKRLIQGPLEEGAVEPPTNPLPAGDLWGQEWVVDTVSTADKAARLNVLPSVAEISVHTLEVVSLYRKAAFDISSFRRFTLGGDVVLYNQQAIDYYNWYLVKSGKQTGFKFADRASEDNYNRIQAYIEKSGLFALIGERQLPDGSSLRLYRRR